MYAGIGPGAHGRVCIDGAVHATRKHKPPAQWLKNVMAPGSNGGHSTVEDTALTPEARAQERVMLGLRLTEGLDLAALEQATGLGRFKVISQEALESLESEGLIARSSDCVRTTARGRLVLNGVIGALLA